MFTWYRFFNGHSILSACTYSGGAFYICTLRFVKEKEEVIKCFHCGRMFRHENGHLVLWPFREYPHLEGRQLFGGGKNIFTKKEVDKDGLGKKMSS